jgi:hypothetical protein
MATKKQKREAALAKRAEFIRNEKMLGQEAQAWDKANRDIETARVKELAAEINARHMAILAREAKKINNIASCGK